nr:pentatricopeptide repeat-containing protein, chloroplastic [Quercus suber]
MWALQFHTTHTLRSSSYSVCTARTSSKPPICSLTLNPSNSTKPETNCNHLIQSLCKQGSLKQALEVLAHEPNPTQHTYEALILSCSRQSSLSDGLDVHRHLVDAGFDQDPFLATKLINMYSELDAIDNARKVFDETRKRTIYVWNALFRALTLAGHGQEVLDLYRRMNQIGIPSDRFTYTYVLKACVASESLISLLLTGKEVHAHILRHGPTVPRWVAQLKVRKMSNPQYLGCVQSWESGIPSCGFLEFDMRDGSNAVEVEK